MNNPLKCCRRVTKSYGKDKAIVLTRTEFGTIVVESVVLEIAESADWREFANFKNTVNATILSLGQAVTCAENASQYINKVTEDALYEAFDVLTIEAWDKAKTKAREIACKFKKK